VRQQLLDAIYGGQPFRTVVRDIGLTSNQVWVLTRTDEEWSEKLEAAFTATRRDDLEHGTNAVYVAGCLQRVPRASAHEDGSATCPRWPGLISEVLTTQPQRNRPRPRTRPLRGTGRLPAVRRAGAESTMHAKLSASPGLTCRSSLSKWTVASAISESSGTERGQPLSRCLLLLNTVPVVALNASNRLHWSLAR
jgi:hypothetical protein